MKPNLNRFAAILLFASAAIICSLTMWATPTVTGLPATLGKAGASGEAPKVGASHSPFGTITHCVGADPAQIVFPFADDYSCVGLGAVPDSQILTAVSHLSTTIRIRFLSAAQQTAL